MKKIPHESLSLICARNPLDPRCQRPISLANLLQTGGGGGAGSAQREIRKEAGPAFPGAVKPSEAPIIIPPNIYVNNGNNGRLGQEEVGETPMGERIGTIIPEPGNGVIPEPGGSELPDITEDEPNVSIPEDTELAPSSLRPGSLEQPVPSSLRPSSLRPGSFAEPTPSLPSSYYRNEAPGSEMATIPRNQPMSMSSTEMSTQPTISTEVTEPTLARTPEMRALNEAIPPNIETGALSPLNGASAQTTARVTYEPLQGPKGWVGPRQKFPEEDIRQVANRDASRMLSRTSRAGNYPSRPALPSRTNAYERSPMYQSDAYGNIRTPNALNLTNSAESGITRSVNMTRSMPNQSFSEYSAGPSQEMTGYSGSISAEAGAAEAGIAEGGVAEGAQAFEGLTEIAELAVL